MRCRLPCECASLCRHVLACVFHDLLLRSAVVAKRRAARQELTLRTLSTLNCHAPEEGVIFNASLPEVLASVARIEVELDRVFVVTLGDDDDVRSSLGGQRAVHLRILRAVT